MDGMVQTQSFELTGFQRDLLYVIAGSDQPSGQAIRRTLEAYIDNVNHGRLYPNLDTLVEHGLVEKGDQDQRTNYYEVTEEGEALLSRRREWENQYVTPPDETDHVSVAQSSSD
jgi:DNA-binding PadR family transcriptional regulator